MDTTQAYRSFRPLLFSIAYRMTASVAEAEDIVQEAFLRYHRELSKGVAIDSPKAFLSAVTTRLCINHLRSARVRREAYVGEWLPEPLLGDGAGLASAGLASAGLGDGAGPAPAAAAEQADSLSMAFLLVLERLSPVERAVFLMYDVFGYRYEEIAGILGKTEANCRQLAVRARRHVSAHRPRFEASRRQRVRLAERFFSAVTDGDVQGLVGMLAEDVVVHGDSGGVPPSWPRPIVGRDRVCRLLAGLGEQIRQVRVTIQPAEVNGQPGALVLDPGGRVVSVFSLDIADGVVQTVRSVINPAKLGHLGPLADVPGLRRELRGPG